MISFNAELLAGFVTVVVLIFGCAGSFVQRVIFLQRL